MTSLYKCGQVPIIKTGQQASVVQQYSMI